MTRPHKSSLPSQSCPCHLYRSVIRHLINIINSDMSVGNSLLPFKFFVIPSTKHGWESPNILISSNAAHLVSFIRVGHFPDHIGGKDQEQESPSECVFSCCNNQQSISAPFWVRSRKGPNRAAVDGRSNRFELLVFRDARLCLAAGGAWLGLGTVERRKIY